VDIRVSLTDKHIFFRSAGEINPTIERAEGIYCYDSDGKRYIDGMGGVGVVSIGHGVTEVFDAAMAQMQKVCFAHPFHWKNAAHMRVTEQIASLAPPGMSSVFMCSGGSEATETALKMVRQYHLARGEPSRYKVIARWSSFHGNTLGSLSMTGMTSRREPFIPLLADFPHIAPSYCYRCPFGKTYPGCGIQCAQDLEAVILREGKESIAAFIAEPLVGAAAGATTPPPEYFRMIRDICDRYGIVMIVDEVITGFGRTGRNFGIDHWGVVPDIICTGKGMSSGYTPLGAVITHEKIYEVFKPPAKGFNHGFTYGGNPLSCAIGSAVLTYMDKHRLIDNVAALGPGFFARASQELATLPIVGDIRGKGFFMGIELVADQQTKQPFPAARQASRKLADIAFARGLITGANRGGIDGVLGDHITLAPPYTCTLKDLQEIIAILKDSILEFQASLQ
jgi:adenosylmethionine-8-amino-7-oxononanoate aminotransferase